MSNKSDPAYNYNNSTFYLQARRKCHKCALETDILLMVCMKKWISRIRHWKTKGLLTQYKTDLTSINKSLMEALLWNPLMLYFTQLFSEECSMYISNKLPSVKWNINLFLQELWEHKRAIIFFPAGIKDWNREALVEQMRLKDIQCW